MQTVNSESRLSNYSSRALMGGHVNGCQILGRPTSDSRATQSSNRIVNVVAKMVPLVLVSCVSTFSSQAFGQSTNPTTDPSWRQAVERVIESYIRSHPEMIEQAQQALEAKRQEEEKVRVKEAIATHRSELLHDPESPVSGDPAGEVTVVEFFDYRCGFCQRAAGSVTQLQKDDTRVRIVYKDFPILGADSVQAAKAALASRSQGQHQAFHEALFAAKGELTREQILQIANDVGLDTKKLVADMDNPEWLAIIERNRALASELGITGTPAFVVGTELVPGAIDLTTLKELVTRARTR